MESLAIEEGHKIGTEEDSNNDEKMESGREYHWII